MTDRYPSLAGVSVTAALTWQRVAPLRPFSRILGIFASVGGGSGAYGVASFHLAALRDGPVSPAEFGTEPRVLFLDPNDNGLLLPHYTWLADTPEGLALPGRPNEPWSLWASISAPPAGYTANLHWNVKEPCCDACGAGLKSIGTTTDLRLAPSGIVKGEGCGCAV